MLLDFLIIILTFFDKLWFINPLKIFTFKDTQFKYRSNVFLIPNLNLCDSYIIVFSWKHYIFPNIYFPHLLSVDKSKKSFPTINSFSFLNYLCVLFNPDSHFLTHCPHQIFSTRFHRFFGLKNFVSAVSGAYSAPANRHKIRFGVSRISYLMSVVWYVRSLELIRSSVYVKAVDASSSGHN